MADEKALELKGKKAYEKLAKQIADLEVQAIPGKEALAKLQKSEAKAKTALSKAKPKEESAIAQKLHDIEAAVAEQVSKNLSVEKKIAAKRGALAKLASTVADRGLIASRLEQRHAERTDRYLNSAEERNEELERKLKELSSQKRKEDPAAKAAKELRAAREAMIEAGGGFGKWVHELKVTKAINFLRDQKDIGFAYQLKDKIRKKHNEKIQAQIELTEAKANRVDAKMRKVSLLERTVAKAVGARIDTIKQAKLKNGRGRLSDYDDDNDFGGFSDYDDDDDDYLSKVSGSRFKGRNGSSKLAKGSFGSDSPLAKIRDLAESGKFDDKDEESASSTAEERIGTSLVRREVSSLEKMANAVEDLSKKKESGDSGGMGLGGKGFKGFSIGNVLKTIGAVAAGAYGAYRAYGELKKLWNGTDENGRPLDNVDKAKSVARLATQAAFTFIGARFGGKYGAAIGAAIAPLISDAAESFGQFLADSEIGPYIGRAVALVVNPLEEFPKLWDEHKESVLAGVNKVKDMVSRFFGGAVDKAKEWKDKAVGAASGVLSSVGSAASSFWSGAKGAVESAPRALASAAGTASTVVKAAAAPVLAAGASAVSATKSAAVSGYNSLASAAGKLWKANMSGVDVAGLQPSVQQNLLGMMEEYHEKTGKVLPINSAFRSRADQEAAYRKDPNKAARPGRSPHEHGIAIDTNSVNGDELDRMGLLAKWGFSRPAMTKKGVHERWHIQVAGTARKASELGINNGDFAENPTQPSSSTEMAAASTSTTSAASTRVAAEGASEPIKLAQGDTFRQAAPSGGTALRAAGNSPKISIDNIPTFSYSDPTFFALNLGALA